MDGRKHNKELNQAIRRIQDKLEKDPTKFKISKKDQDILNKELDRLQDEDFNVEAPQKIDVKFTKREFSREEFEMLEEIRREHSFFNRLKKKISSLFG